MRALVRILPLGLLAVLASVAFAGCGGVTLDPVAAAATKAADAGSYRFTYSLDLAAGPSQAAQSVSGTGSYDAASKRLAMTLGVEGQRVETITDLSSSPAFYLRMPALLAKLPAGKSWLEIDFAKAAKKYGLDLGQLSPSGVDPTSAFDALKQSSYSTKVGSERIGGVQTTHYLVTVDLKQLLKGEPEAQRQLTEKLLKAAGITSFPVDVWIDGSGLLRRITFDFGGGTSGLFAATMRMDVSDYGTDVRVDLPPAGEVADAAQYLPAH